MKLQETRVHSKLIIKVGGGGYELPVPPPTSYECVYGLRIL